MNMYVYLDMDGEEMHRQAWYSWEPYFEWILFFLVESIVQVTEAAFQCLFDLCLNVSVYWMFHSSDNSLSVQLFCCYLQICLISFEYHKGFVLLIIHWQWGTVENQTLRQKRRLQFSYCEISISISRLSPDMTNYRVCYMSGTEGAARGKGAAHPSGAPELIPGFEWGSCYSIFSFMCCYVDHRLCVVSFYFGHGVICPSIFDVLNAPLVCSTLFLCKYCCTSCFRWAL